MIDLIVTDVVMPGLRGPALVERALQIHPEARVIYISGYAEAEFLRGVADSGAPLVHKPFRLQRLLEIVASELERGEAAAGEGAETDAAGGRPDATL